MESSLFDSEEGYYSTNIRGIGRASDFSTTTTLSDSLSKAITVWVSDRWKNNKELPHTIIEIGAGDGSLAEGISKGLGFFGRRGLRYHVVEKSRPLREM